jgi:penicillin V acylase-like amidase (Ntn superfamily)
MLRAELAPSREVAMRFELSALLLVLSLPSAAADRTETPVEGCTCTCLDHAGTCIFGQNFDFPFTKSLLFVNKRGVAKTGWDAGRTGEVARWSSRYGSVTFSQAGYQQAWGGMNEAGLVVGSMHHPAGGATRFDARPTLAGGLWVQYQLDTAATVREVLESELTIRNFGVFMHYLVCDRTGACATIEYLEGKQVAHTGPTLPIKVLANDGYDESLEAWRAHRPSGDAQVRFRDAAEKLSARARTAPAQLPAEETGAEIADATAVQDAFGVQAHVSRPGTVWTAVYDNKNLRVYFRTGRDPRIRELRFAELDFSTATPVRMLDLDADLVGNISDRLPAYSHEQSLAQALAYNRALSGVFPGVYGMSDEAVEVMLGWAERWR